MATITTVEVDQELIVEAATTLEFIGELADRFVGGSRSTELHRLADSTAFHLLMQGLSRRFGELIRDADGEPLNEWAEVQARVEKRMEEWPEWPNPLEGVEVE